MTTPTATDGLAAEQYLAACRALLGMQPEHSFTDVYVLRMASEVCDPQFFQAALAVAYRAGREAAATDVGRMPCNLGDEGWDHLTRKAVEAGYDEAPTRRRQRDHMSFTHATIVGAYQYGYRRAAEVARG